MCLLEFIVFFGSDYPKCDVEKQTLSSSIITLITLPKFRRFGFHGVTGASNLPVRGQMFAVSMILDGRDPNK